jgi:hypothetical protein
MSKRAAIIVLSICAMAVSPQAGAAASKKRVCKPLVTSSGLHKIQKISRRAARQQWAQQVEALYGASWASLSNAVVHQDGCTMQYPNWQCVYDARPCRWESTLKPSPQMPSLNRYKQPKIN